MHEQEPMPDARSLMDPAAAAAALAHAERAQDRARHAVRAGSAWTSQLLAAFGVASVVFLTLTGALPGVGGGIAYLASWAAYGAISTWFGRRERVSWRGFDRLSGKCFVAWLVLQGAGCAVGFNLFPGNVAYWAPVAWVVSAPLFVGAWRAARR